MYYITKLHSHSCKQRIIDHVHGVCKQLEKYFSDYKHKFDQQYERNPWLDVELTKPKNSSSTYNLTNFHVAKVIRYLITLPLPIFPPVLFYSIRHILLVHPALPNERSTLADWLLVAQRWVAKRSRMLRMRTNLQ